MHVRLTSLVLCIVVLLSLSVIAAVAQDETPVTAEASASLMNVDGEEIGIVTLAEQEDQVTLTAALENLPPGFHGFHIHTVGSCEDSGEGPFTAAGDHFNPDGTEHPNHAGDLPTLLVLEDGSAYLAVKTDRFILEDLLDEDGSAVIVHANSNNFANIPERYGGPDEETLSAGDSGDRIACGVIAQGNSM